MIRKQSKQRRKISLSGQIISFENMKLKSFEEIKLLESNNSALICGPTEFETSMTSFNIIDKNYGRIFKIEFQVI